MDWTSLRAVVNGNETGAEFTGFERVLLTTCGNLQRVVSAYYNSRVSVEIVRNQQMTETDDYLRNVILSADVGVDTIPFGLALSRVSISDLKYASFYRDKQPGLGQFFQHYRLYPEFTLISVGRNDCTCLSDNDWPWPEAMSQNVRKRYSVVLQGWPSGYIWRLYKMSSAGIECDILELLRSDIHQLPASND